MKIVISPSKTTNLTNNQYLTGKEPLFKTQTEKLLQILQKLSKEELSKALNIKTSILEKTFQDLKDYDNTKSFQAFPSFNGLVFKNMDINAYGHKEFTYINSHLLILDAFYGVLEPNTLIKPYRLDMKAKLGINLYKFWNIDAFLKDDLIINLASNEFSKMISKPMITITFLQKKDGKYINQATYAKMARGLYLDFLIKNQVKTIEDLFLFDQDNYRYNMQLSDEHTITFTR